MLADIEFDLDLDDSVIAMEKIAKIFNGRKAFFVLGPEGSGTHMMRNALVKAGCYWEQAYEEEGGTFIFKDKPAPLVVRRSIPHANKWPKLFKIYDQLDNADYRVHAIFMIRDFNATAKSVLRRGYGKSETQNHLNQQEAFLRVAEFVENSLCKFTYVTYEAFCFSAGFRKWLFEDRFCLAYPQDFQIFEGNSQYYG